MVLKRLQGQTLDHTCNWEKEGFPEKRTERNILDVVIVEFGMCDNYYQCVQHCQITQLVMWICLCGALPHGRTLSDTHSHKDDNDVINP